MELMKVLKQSLLFLLLTSISGFAYAKLPLSPCHSVCQRKLPSETNCVRVGKQIIYYRLSGQGKPTMIFSSGTGFSADDWFESDIAKEMAKKTQVLTYDRLYTFNSCPNNNNYMPNTAQDVVNRLRRLLKNEKISPPYILVGQSFGGLYMLLFAREYPADVAGLVLMDATSSSGPTPLPKKALPILKRQGNPQNPAPTEQLYNEVIGQLPSYLQIKKTPPLPKDMPLIVMYATKHCLPKSLTEGKLFCMTKQEEANHVKQQLKIYNMSNNHFLYKVIGPHMSFFDKSKHAIVMKALHQILRMVKSHPQA